VGCLDLKLLTH
jgi:uncharacterized protein YacL